MFEMFGYRPGVPLEVSQRVGKRAKKRNEGEGKRKHLPAFLSGLYTNIWT